MRRTPRNIAAVLAALTLGGVVTRIGSMTAQQPACLHGQDEAAAQQTRRRGALTLTRQINTLENVAFNQARQYQPVTALANVSAPPQGFSVHFVTDGATYAFLVTDTLDPCAFAYFSDEAGLIYAGQALQ